MAHYARPNTTDESLDATLSCTPASPKKGLDFAILDGRKVMIAVFLTLLLIAGVADAQTAKRERTGTKPIPTAEKASLDQTKNNEAFPLREIRIVGNENFPTDEIIAVTGLEIGKLARPYDFERGGRRLEQTGVFDSWEFRWGPKDDGYVVTYTVAELVELYPVRFEGFGVPEDEILNTLRERVPLFGSKVPPTGPMVRRIGNTLQALWREQGNETKIVGDINVGSEDEFEMLFQPLETIRTIAFVKFENADAISALDLQRDFNQVAIGEPYSERRLFELLKFNVLPKYAAIGRLEAKFCPCRAEPDPDTEGLIVTIPVEEGAEYKFGNVELPLTTGIDPDELGRLMQFTSGRRAEIGQVRETLDRIEEQLKRKGFLKVQTSFDENRDPEAKTIDIALRVSPGSQYTFKSLKISGLNLIAEAAVKKRWGLKVGEPFNATYPAFFLERIRAEQMFDNLAKTDSKVQISELEKTVDVELIFN